MNPNHTIRPRALVVAHHRIAMLPIAALLAVTGLVDAAGRRRSHDDAGQATAEYALVLLGVAAIALAVISWATRTNLIGKLLDVVFGGLLRKVK